VFFRVARLLAWPRLKENSDVTAITSRERSAKSRTGATFPGLRSAPSGSTIVSPLEGLDLAAAPALREQLIDVLHRGTDRLILDLSEVPACDVAGLAVLIGTQRRARLLGIPMLLVAPSLPVQQTLSSSGLYRSFTICPDLPAALAAERHEAARLAPVAPPLAVASSF
jgi:anti-anti-sigma factor